MFLVDDRGKIPLADIRKLIKSFRSHCMEVIQAKDKFADIIDHNVVKRRTFLKFTTQHTLCKIATCELKCINMFTNK